MSVQDASLLVYLKDPTGALCYFPSRIIGWEGHKNFVPDTKPGHECGRCSCDTCAGHKSSKEVPAAQ